MADEYWGSWGTGSEKGYIDIEVRYSDAKARAGMKSTAVAADQLSSGINKIGTAGKGLVKEEATWWKRFGAVALGFTIVYRAMNALESGIRGLVSAMIDSIPALDDFNKRVASATAVMTSAYKTGNPFENYTKFLPFVRQQMEDLEILSAQHLVTAEEINEVYASLMKKSVVPLTEKDLKTVALLADAIKLVGREFRGVAEYQQEIFALMEGERGRGRELFNWLSRLNPELKEQLKIWQQIGTTAEGHNAVLEGLRENLVSVQAAQTEVLRLWSTWLSTAETVYNRMRRMATERFYERATEELKDIVGLLFDAQGATERLEKIALAWAAALTVAEQAIRIPLDLLKKAETPLEMISKYLTKIAIKLRVARFLINEIYNLVDATRILVKKAWAEGKLLFFNPDNAEELRKQIEEYDKALDAIKEASHKEEENVRRDIVDMYTGRYNLFLKKAREEPPKAPIPTLDQDEIDKAMKSYVKDMIKMYEEIGARSKDIVREQAAFERDTREKEFTEMYDQRLITEAQYASAVHLLWNVYYKKMKEVTGNTLEGIKEGYRNYYAEISDVFANAKTLAESTAKAMESAFSDLFVDVAMGKIKKFSDYVAGILRATADYTAKIFMQMIMPQPVSPSVWIPGFSSPSTTTGGPTTLFQNAPIPHLHNGLAPDEFPAILQRGETVLKKGFNPGSNTYNVSIQALDAQSFSDVMRRNSRAILEPLIEASEYGDRSWRKSLRNI